MPEHFLPLENDDVMTCLLPDANWLTFRIQRGTRFQHDIATIYNFETLSSKCFLSRNINPEIYKSQYKPLPKSNCWYKISAYKWQQTMDKPTKLG